MSLLAPDAVLLNTIPLVLLPRHNSLHRRPLGSNHPLDAPGDLARPLLGRPGPRAPHIIRRPDALHISHGTIDVFFYNAPIFNNDLWNCEWERGAEE